MAALARRVGVPFRSGGQFTASKYPDAQAAYESASTLLPTVSSGVNFVLHGLEVPERSLCRFAIDAALEIDVEDVLERCVRLGTRFDLREVQPALRENPDAPRERALFVSRRENERGLAGDASIVVRSLWRDDDHARVVLWMIRDPALERDARLSLQLKSPKLRLNWPKRRLKANGLRLGNMPLPWRF